MQFAPRRARIREIADPTYTTSRSGVRGSNFGDSMIPGIGTIGACLTEPIA
jgi:hypothetical protein